MELTSGLRTSFPPNIASELRCRRTRRRTMELPNLSLPRIPLLAVGSRSTNAHQVRFPICSPSSHKTRCLADFPNLFSLVSLSFTGSLLRPSSPAAPGVSRFASISSCTALSGSGGGSDGLDQAGGGGGGDGGGEAGVQSLAGESNDVSALGEDLIALHVEGMSCGGCAASVKRILESQPQVSSANVIFEKETAFVWTVAEVKATQDWKNQLGEKLAKHLTTCGFKSDLQGNYAGDREG